MFPSLQVKNMEDFDRQLKVTPMRYFKKYCPFTSSSVKDEWMKKWIVTSNHQTILYAKTCDEIRHVYESGPGSCMSHNKSRFWGEHSPLPHPVEGYAGGDLVVAYIRRSVNGLPYPIITARVVVWPEQKVMGAKVYGSDAHLLRMLLEDEGYETKKNGFHGARLLKIYYPKENCYILPYIDGGKVLLTLEGEIVLDTYGVDATITNGVIALYPPYKSDKSGEIYYPHKTSKITVHIEEGKKEIWAQCELTPDVYQCGMTGYYYKASYIPPVKVLNSQLFDANAESAKKITDRCEYYHVPTLEKTVTIIAGYSAKGIPVEELWSVTAAVGHSFAYRGGRYAEWLCSNLKSPHALCCGTSLCRGFGPL